MERKKKEEVVAELHEKLSRAKTVIFADYKGLKTPEITKLRKSLRDEKVDFKVIKNTLMRLACKDTDTEVAKPLIDGTCAIAIGYDDPVTPAKLLKNFTKESDKLVIKGGVLQNRLLSVQDVVALSLIPGREVLLGNLLSVFVAYIFSKKNEKS